MSLVHAPSDEMIPSVAVSPHKEKHWFHDESTYNDNEDEPVI
jgi:hypothetical protein